MRYERDGFAVEVLIERGQPPPSWYEEEPDCPPGLDYYMKAFWQLSTERSIGFSVGPIPASKIEEDIVDPNAEIAPGYPENVMPSNFGQSLSKQELEQLVEFLLEKAAGE